MVVHELGAIEQFVILNIKLSGTEDVILSEAYLEESLQAMAAEIERIRNAFINAAFDHDRELSFELYIQHHQSAIIHLADRVFIYEQSIFSKKSGKVSIRFYREIVGLLLTFLDFIEQQFPAYFNQDIKLPCIIKNGKSVECNNAVKVLEKELEQSSVDQDLARICLTPMKEFLNRDAVSSYRGLHYVNQLEAELFSMAVKNNELVIYLLVYLNFNSRQFYEYYIQRIVQRSVNCNNLIEYYSREMKLLNQVQVKPHFAYDHTAPGIKAQLGTWISEELYHLEKLQQYCSFNVPNGNEHTITDPKVQTSLSVSQLSVGIRLLIDSGIIINKNVTEVMKMVAKNFKTDRLEHISEGSLRNKIYNFESGAVDKVKDVVIGLLNLVNGY